MKLGETLGILRDELKPSLTKECYGISTYGSAARGEDFVEGWSDVDVLIVSKDNFHCSRDFYNETADWYTRVRERMEEKGVNWGIEDEVGFSVYDKGSIESGRYCWMIPGFKEHLRRSTKTIWGDDVRKILSKEQPRANEESGIAYALWRTRETASILDYNRKHDERQFKYDIKKSTKALKNLIRNAVVLKAGKVRADANPRIVEEFIGLFPEVNSESVLETQNISLLWPNLRQNEMMNLFYKGLEIREAVVKVLATDKRV